VAAGLEAFGDGQRLIAAVADDDVAALRKGNRLHRDSGAVALLILERDRGLGSSSTPKMAGAWPTTIPAAMTIMIAIRIAPIRFSVPNVSLELIGGVVVLVFVFDGRKMRSPFADNRFGSG